MNSKNSVSGRPGKLVADLQPPQVFGAYRNDLMDKQSEMEMMVDQLCVAHSRGVRNSRARLGVASEADVQKPANCLIQSSPRPQKRVRKVSDAFVMAAYDYPNAGG